MKIKNTVISVFLLLLLTIGVQAKNVSNTGSAGSAEFEKAADQFMRASLVISPVNASQAGFHNYTDPKTGKTVELDALLDDLGPAGIAAQKKFYTEWQQRFRRFDRASLSKEDNADWQLIDDQIALSLLEFDRIQSYQHNPTGYVELVGNALFLPMSQNYAAADVRIGHVLARIGQIPRAMDQAKQVLLDSDPIFISTALDENEGNIDLIEHTVKEQIPAGSALEKQYAQVAAPAIQALKDFSTWLQNDLAKRPTSRTWRLGKEFYDAKFKLVMETPVTPEEILQKAEQQMTAVRAEMLTLAEPMHQQLYPDHTEHNDLPAQQRQNLIISEVLTKISDDHVQRDELMDHIKGDLAGIIQFIREKQIVGLSNRDNLKVIATPLFMRGIYSVAGFHSPPPLEPTAEAQYWVTPIAKTATEKAAESKLREYNNYALKWLTIHEALPGHYIQFEHANNVQPETRRLLRSLFGNGAYVEGWAEYIAQVMMDEGYLNEDPKFRMVMRKVRLRVLSNTILDVRMQTMNMTDEQAMDLMINQAFQTQAEADGKLRRAKLSSVQLPTYFVGINDWFQLRKDYQAKMGSNFNLEEFHNKALDEGPLPIMLLRGIMMPQ